MLLLALECERPPAAVLQPEWSAPFVNELMLADEAGALFWTSCVQGPNSQFCYGGGLVVFLDPETGAFRAAVRVEYDVWAGLVDADGSLFVEARRALPENKRVDLIVALDLEGNRRWTSDHEVVLHGLGPGWVFAKVDPQWARREETLSKETGEAGPDYPSDPTVVIGFGDRVPAWSDDAMFMRASPVDAGSEYARHLYRLDPRTGAVKWSTYLDDHGRIADTTPIVTDHGTALLATGSWGISGREPDHIELREYELDGGLRFSCLLPDGVQPSAPLLVGGRWIVKSNGTAYAFPVSGRALARTGWPTMRADNQRRNRVRTEVRCPLP